VRRVLFFTALAATLGSAPALAQPPAPVPAPPCAPGDAQFACGQRAPEDLVAVPGGEWVVASSYVNDGAIALVRVRDRVSMPGYPAPTARNRLDAERYGACPGPPDPAVFQTHGLSLQPGTGTTHRLYVVAHGGRESVEVFELDAAAAVPVLTWIGCVVAPDPIGLNSVRWLSDGGFIATNFLPRGQTFQSLQAGQPNGELWEWHAASGWQEVPGSETSGANGVEISDDGRWLYVAAWGSQSFYRLSYGGTPVERQDVPLGFRVDNIRWARDGTILAAGQGGAPGAQASIIVSIDPDTLEVRELVRRPDVPGFGAGTVAVEVGETYWVGSFRGDRIAIFPR
jgi:hypothetical protein